MLGRQQLIKEIYRLSKFVEVFMATITGYEYTKTPFNSDTFKSEVAASAIVIALERIDTNGSAISVYFKDSLSEDDILILDYLLAEHDGDIPASLDPPLDSDGSLIVRPKTTKTGWHFEPRSLDFVTAKRKSLYNKKFDTFTISGGTDIGDGVIRFFDSSGTELIQSLEESDIDFQTRVTDSCVVTYVDWEPHYTFDIKGLFFQIKNPPTTPAYLWVIAAPDIPAVLGGQVCFGNGGWNLSYFLDKQIFDVDGGGVKSIVYDPIYHSSKIRVLIKHDVGLQIGLQIIYKQYKV